MSAIIKKNLANFFDTVGCLFGFKVFSIETQCPMYFTINKHGS